VDGEKTRQWAGRCGSTPLGRDHGSLGAPLWGRDCDPLPNLPPGRRRASGRGGDAPVGGEVRERAFGEGIAIPSPRPFDWRAVRCRAIGLSNATSAGLSLLRSGHWPHALFRCPLGRRLPPRPTFPVEGACGRGVSMTRKSASLGGRSARHAKGAGGMGRRADGHGNALAGDIPRSGGRRMLSAPR
jgi:hypothetical protein